MAFHVPEGSRVLGTAADGNNGAFRLPSPEPGWYLMIIASDGTEKGFEPWDHVSVHAYRDRNNRPQTRTPMWGEMTFIKDLFWDPEDVVMQLHPRRSEYVNTHPHVLHLWRPRHIEIPTPPRLYV